MTLSKAMGNVSGDMWIDLTNPNELKFYKITEV